MFQFWKKLFSFFWTKSESDPKADAAVAQQELVSTNSPLSLSFSGSGFLSLYQIGAVKALLEQAPEILKSAPKVYGASAGSLVAAAVVFKVNLDQSLQMKLSGNTYDILNLLLNAATEARKTTLGPLCPRFNLIKNLHKALLHLLPDNAHQMATGRLFVALTRLSDLKDIMVSDYKSKEEVVQVLICSCFVPFYCGIVPPSFRGVRYFDGGCTNFHPFVNLSSILTVSPFSGEIDICPRDCPVSFCVFVLNASFQLSIENLRRVIYALFPPQTMVLNEYYCRGYKDAVIFLNHMSKNRGCGRTPKKSHEI
ncbi:patatin-like phospholipase domain-containing 1 [Pelobates cultripes]|uniref:Patatin-like phospholipase domain-containing 1 n=1 Tax=Pelobates cultripes TaxID=61616 RepID=A0AAD1QZA1_PELCU|nr:patatin-like phospholipase domain-containing 1 [Pelobates cultripes]